MGRAICGVLIALGVVAGCSITETQHNIDRPVRTFRVERPGDRMSAELTRGPSAGDDTTVTLRVMRGATCSIEQREIVDRTIVTEREYEGGGSVAYGYVVGLAGASLTTWSAIKAADGDRAGLWLLAGIPLTIPLPVAIVDSVRLMDSEEHIGPVEDTSRVVGETPCKGTAVGDARVELRSGGRVIASGTTNEEGRVQLTVPKGSVQPDGVSLHVNGEANGKLNAFDELAAAAEQAKSDAAQAEASAVLKEEMESGRCSAARQQALMQHLSYVRQVGGNRYLYHDHDVVVASEAGTPVDISRWVLTGELHIFLHPASQGGLVAPLRLEVKDEKGYDSKITVNGYDTLFAGEGGDSRVVLPRRAEKLSVKVIGSGCALVVAMEPIRP